MYSPSRGHNPSHRGSPYSRPQRGPRHTPPGSRGRYHDRSYASYSNGSPFGHSGPNQSPYGPPGPNQSPYRPSGHNQSPYGPRGASQSPYGSSGPSQSPYGSQGPNHSPYGPHGHNQSPYGPPRQTTPRHSTPFFRGGRGRQSMGGSMTEFFTPQQSPMQPSGDDSSYFTAPEAVSSSDASFAGERGRGRGRRPFRRTFEEGQNSMYGKRRRTDFNKTFPGSLLKPTMLEEPWSQVVPMKCPEDGLVLSGGQRHSVLTSSKAAAVVSGAEKTYEADASGEIDLTD